MQLDIIEISRVGARESAADARRAAKRTNDPVLQDEYLSIARAYERAVKEDVRLISLAAAVRAGGTMIRQHSSLGTRLLPKIAVCPSDARYVFTLGVRQNGSVEFVDRATPSHQLRRGRIDVDAGFEWPGDGYRAGDSLGPWSWRAWSAVVPPVPPKLMPTIALSNFVTLWEVEDWQVAIAPRPPGDPALLRHLAGDLYIVEATWDLTPLEQLVITGRPRVGA